MSQTDVEISTAFIKLDSLLKFAGLAASGGEAARLIADGRVSHNGAVCTERGRKVRKGDTVRIFDTEVNVK